MFTKQQITLLLLLILFSLFACGLWAVEVATEQPRASVSTRALSPFPRVGPYEVLCGDFHIHTKHSDGGMSPDGRVLEAWQHGLDAIAITDHGKTLAYKEALPTAKALGVILLTGFETGLNKQEHLVVLGASENYQPRDSHRWAELPGQDRAFYQNELRDIAKSGGVVIYAHPHVGMREPARWGIDQGIIRGIEVMNGVVGEGWNTIESHGTWCYPNGFDWALEHNLGVFANSDLHGARAGRPPVTTLVLVKQRTASGVIDAIRNRRTIAWFNDMLWGPSKLLSELMGSLVKVRSALGEGGETLLQVENRGPVPLKVTLPNEWKIAPGVEIAPYRVVLAKCENPPDKLTIRWDNLWVSPKENLVTTHPLGAK